MKYTLLEMVQQILRTTDGDEVNGITDTAEAEAVAHIIKENYFNIVGDVNLPEHLDFFELDATSSLTPTLMTRPAAVMSLSWIKYNNILTTETNNRFLEVYYQDVNEFINLQEMLNTDSDNIDSFDVTIGTAVINFKYRNDKMPQFYTTWDDENILFDSINTDEDAMLQKSKTWCYGAIEPTFSMTNTYTPDLDGTQFQLLLNASRAQYNLHGRQTQDAISLKREHDNKITTQINKEAIPYGRSEYSKMVDFGKKCATGYTGIPKYLRNGS